LSRQSIAPTGISNARWSKIGERVTLRYEDEIGIKNYYTTVIRNIVDYSQAKLILGGYNDENAHNTPFVKVLVLERIH